MMSSTQSSTSTTPDTVATLGQLPGLTTSSHIAPTPLADEYLATIHIALVNNWYTNIPYTMIRNLAKFTYRIISPTPFAAALEELWEDLRQRMENACITAKKASENQACASTYLTTQVWFGFQSAWQIFSSAIREPTPPMPFEQPSPTSPISMTPTENRVLPNCNTNGPAERHRTEIFRGIFIPYSEGRAWLQRVHGVGLPDDHSVDFTILMYMVQDIEKYGLDTDLRLVQAQDSDPSAMDLLIVTKRICGEFINSGPAGVEEILEESIKNKLEPADDERNAIDALLEVLGR
jgi:hypothetical protein